MDAIALLHSDHQTVEKHFKAFEKAGERAHATRRREVDAMIRELSVHAAIEEQVFYPAVRATMEEANDTVLESLEEHHVVKWILSELDGMPAEAERFEAKVTVLIENVRHHVEEEEKELFPKVRKAFTKPQLEKLGEQMAEAKKLAPTHPHPRQPDTPPLNLVAGIIGATADVARDLVRTATGRPAPSNGATGTARRTARSVRKEATSRTSRAANTAQRKAKSTAKTTRRTAASATRSASGAAKGAARGASTGAKRGARAGTRSGTGSRSRSTTRTSARQAS
jgi:hemerythrin superfamily protein